MTMICSNHKNTWKDNLMVIGFIVIICGLFLSLIYFGGEKNRILR